MRMAYSPFDWNEAIRHRSDYIEERLRDGSPVVGLSLPQGLLLVTVRRTQRKVYEIYDRLMFAGIGNQSDLEAVRLTAIDFAHNEGYTRSPDDVTAQRLMSVISPPLKRAFQDQFGQLFVIRALFADLADRQEQDLFFTLQYDGEFTNSQGFAAVAGARSAEESMTDLLGRSISSVSTVEQGLRLGLEAWATGRRFALRRGEDEDLDEPRRDEAREVSSILKEELAGATVEAALLERNTTRESRFRLLGPREIDPAVAEYR
jgi:proteasome alpha subunit